MATWDGVVPSHWTRLDGDDKEFDLVYQRLNIEGLQEPFLVPIQ